MMRIRKGIHRKRTKVNIPKTRAEVKEVPGEDREGGHGEWRNTFYGPVVEEVLQI